MRSSAIAATLTVLGVAGLTALAQEQGGGPASGGARFGGGGIMMGRVLMRLATDPKAKAMVAVHTILTPGQIKKMRTMARDLRLANGQGDSSLRSE